MMKRKISILVLMIVVMMVVLAGCFPGDGTSTLLKRAGFPLGFWHGLIAPVSLVAGYFDKDIDFYEKFNRGLEYDLGFYIGVVGGWIVLLGRGRRKS